MNNLNTISALQPYEKAGLPSAFLKRMRHNMLETGTGAYSPPPALHGLFDFTKTPEGAKFWLYVQLDFDRLCKFKGNAEHVIEYLLEQDKQGVTMDIGVWCTDPFAMPSAGGIDFSRTVQGHMYWTYAADMVMALIRQGEIFHEPEPFVSEVALAAESYNLDLFTSVPEAEQPKPHLGDSGIRKHSCGELYPHVIVYRGELDNLKRNIIIAGREFPSPDMPIPELKKWADALAKDINSGKIHSHDKGELGKPILIEHFKRQGYDEAMAELIVMRHRQARGYYSMTLTHIVQNAFIWADTPEGNAFWKAVSSGKIKKLSVTGKHLPIDPRVIAAVFALQLKQSGSFKPEALVNSKGELSIKPSVFDGVDLREFGLVDLYFMIWYAPSESLMRACTKEFLVEAYKHLNS